MWTEDGIILLGALICAILLPLLAVVVDQVDGEVETATSSPNKWDSSEIWKDLPDVPAKWGEQYDLELNRDCGVSEEFAPIITMPKEMVTNLFAKQRPMEEESTGILDRGRTLLRGLVSKATTGIKEKLDEASGKVQSMMNDFQKKKTGAVINIKEKLDKKTDEIEDHLKEVSKKVGCEKASEKCIQNAKGSFEKYQESLQQAMDPCLNEMNDAINDHESRIEAAKGELNELLSQLKNCTEGNQASGGMKERLGAVFGTIQCTTITLANQVKSQLGSKMKKLADAVKKAGTLKKEVDGAKKCIDEPPKYDQVEKQQAKLVGMLNKC